MPADILQLGSYILPICPVKYNQQEGGVTEQIVRHPGVEFPMPFDSSEIKARPGYQAVAILHHNRIQ